MNLCLSCNTAALLARSFAQSRTRSALRGITTVACCALLVWLANLVTSLVLHSAMIVIRVLSRGLVRPSARTVLLVCLCCRCVVCCVRLCCSYSLAGCSGSATALAHSSTCPTCTAGSFSATPGSIQCTQVCCVSFAQLTVRARVIIVSRGQVFPFNRLHLLFGVSSRQITGRARSIIVHGLCCGLRHCICWPNLLQRTLVLFILPCVVFLFLF